MNITTVSPSRQFRRRFRQLFQELCSLIAEGDQQYLQGFLLTGRGGCILEEDKAALIIDTDFKSMEQHFSVSCTWGAINAPVQEQQAVCLVLGFDGLEFYITASIDQLIRYQLVVDVLMLIDQRCDGAVIEGCREVVEGSLDNFFVEILLTNKDDELAFSMTDISSRPECEKLLKVLTTGRPAP